MDNETIARDANGTETRDSDGIEKMEIHEAPDGGSGGISENSAHWGTKRIFKNLLVICLCFMCLFTAFQALSNLQSSINCDAGLGLASLSTIYATLVVSAIFIPSITIRYLGMKWTIAAATLCYAVYIAANFYPSWATLIPTSALLGLSAAPLWAAKSTYVTTIGKRYALISGNTENAIINRFFGIFFLFFQSSQVLGNLISSLVLRQDTSEDVTGEFVCGANDCPAGKKIDSNNTLFPGQLTRSLGTRGQSGDPRKLVKHLKLSLILRQLDKFLGHFDTDSGSKPNRFWVSLTRTLF